MENKNVGWLILGISVMIIIIIFLFNNAMKIIVQKGCPAVHLGYSCPAFTTITQQTYLALSIVGVLAVIGFVLIFSSQKEKIIVRKIKETERKNKTDISYFNKEEKKVFKLIQKEKAIFQADLIEKTNFGKVKMSRLLDRFEGKGLIERKRRGMNNIVVLKQ